MHSSGVTRMFTASATIAAALSLAACGSAETAAKRANPELANPVGGGDGQCVDVPAEARAGAAPRLPSADTTNPQATITILDAGTVESLPRAPQSMMPPAPTQLLFAVVRSGNLDSSVEVHYSTQAASATEYADFEPAYGYVAFAPQQTVKYIRIAVRDDADPECPEEFALRLEGAYPNAVILVADASGTILDDDAGSDQQPEMPEPVTERLLGASASSDYCEPIVEPQPESITACAAVSCATGQPLYWTYCPGGQAVSDLLAALN